MMFASIFSSIAVIAFVALVVKRFTRAPASNLTGMPSPPSTPFFGHMPIIIKTITSGSHINIMLTEMWKTCGKLFKLNMISHNVVIVTDLKLVKEVLCTSNYPKSFTYDAFRPAVGKHSILLAAHDAAGNWHRLRKLFNPGFTYPNLKGMVPIFNAKTRLLQDELQVAAEQKGVVKLHQLLTLLTLDVISQAMLGKDFDLLSNVKSPELYQRFVALVDPLAYLFENRHMGWTRYLPWTYASLWYKQYMYDRMLLGFIKKSLEEQEAAAGAGLTDAKVASGGTVVGMAMQAAKIEGKPLDADEILSQVKTFLFAGHDTTATSIAWAVYEVSQHPEVEHKVVQEIRQVCGEREPTADDLGHLKYLGAVFKEALRLWPAAGSVRRAPPGAELQGFPIAGSAVYAPQYVIHRDPALWGEDADTFRPERWLDEAKVAAMHPCAYQPFSKGPRDCIGQTLARMLSKSLLAMLYSKFSFTYAGPEPERQHDRVTTHPRFGVPVRVSLRAD